MSESTSKEDFAPKPEFKEAFEQAKTLAQNLMSMTIEARMQTLGLNPTSSLVQKSGKKVSPKKCFLKKRGRKSSQTFGPRVFPLTESQTKQLIEASLGGLLAYYQSQLRSECEEEPEEEIGNKLRLGSMVLV